MSCNSYEAQFWKSKKNTVGTTRSNFAITQVIYLNFLEINIQCPEIRLSVFFLAHPPSSSTITRSMPLSSAQMLSNHFCETEFPSEAPAGA